jgi:AhpD family alkylhydroperoxidase
MTASQLTMLSLLVSMAVSGAIKECTMRVTVKNTNEYPWFIRPFFWNQKKKYGVVLQPGLVWARVPKLFASVAILYGALDRKGSPLDPVLRSLVTVRVSQINWCHFCVDINASTLAKRDGSLQKAEQVGQWQDSHLFSETERVVLEYTEAITFSDQQVTDELMQRLKGFFDDDGVVELTGLIAFQNLSSKFNSALDVPAQGFCKLPFDPAGLE